MPVSHWFEIKYWWVGKTISASCHVIGWFRPCFFAGRLESGNACEHFVMMQHFHALGIREHDAILYEIGPKEKEHKVCFLAQIKDSRWLPFFERVFAWGRKSSANDVDLAKKYPVAESHRYCAARRRDAGQSASNSASSPSTPAA